MLSNYNFSRSLPYDADETGSLNSAHFTLIVSYYFNSKTNCFTIIKKFGNNNAHDTVILQEHFTGSPI